MRIEQAWAQLHTAADLAAARGSLLFHLDLATEVARTAFDARGVAPDALATLVDEQGYRVLAFDAGPARRALAEARFDASGAALVLPAPDRLPPRAATIADARVTIAGSRFVDPHPGEERAAIVIPADDPHAPLQGYSLAVGADPDRVHLGGHWLLTLDSAGRGITARRPLAGSSDPAPSEVRALRDATLVDPGAVPNELHTYLSLKHNVPIIVATQESGVRWRIDGERTATA